MTQDELREAVIMGLEAVGEWMRTQVRVPTIHEASVLVEKLRRVDDAIELLKSQKPHLVTEADFVDADNYGFLMAWCEERDGDLYVECINKYALDEPAIKYRWWTARPSEAQRKEAKWDAAESE